MHAGPCTVTFIHIQTYKTYMSAPLQKCLDTKPVNAYVMYVTVLHSIVEDMKDDSKFNKFEVESRQITCPVQLIWGKEDQVCNLIRKWKYLCV